MDKKLFLRIFFIVHFILNLSSIYTSFDTPPLLLQMPIEMLEKILSYNNGLTTLETLSTSSLFSEVRKIYIKKRISPHVIDCARQKFFLYSQKNQKNIFKNIFKNSCKKDENNTIIKKKFKKIYVITKEMYTQYIHDPYFFLYNYNARGNAHCQKEWKKIQNNISVDSQLINVNAITHKIKISHVRKIKKARFATKDNPCLITIESKASSNNISSLFIQLCKQFPEVIIVSFLNNTQEEIKNTLDILFCNNNACTDNECAALNIPYWGKVIQSKNKSTLIYFPQSLHHIHYWLMQSKNSIEKICNYFIDSKKQNVLHYLSENILKNNNILRFFMHKDANMYAKNSEGNTPLHTIVLSNDDEECIIDILSRYNKLNIKNNSNTNLLHIALRKKNYIIAHFLCDSFYSSKIINEKSKKEDIPLLQCIQNILMLSEKENNKEKEFFLKLINTKDIDINITNNRGQTVLHKAVLYAQYDIIKELLNIKEINKDAKDRGGDTPLHYAALCFLDYKENENMRKKYIKIIKLLIEKNAHLFKKNAQGKRPIEYIPKKYWTEIFELLGY